MRCIELPAYFCYMQSLATCIARGSVVGELLISWATAALHYYMGALSFIMCEWSIFFELL
jgi:hypothetical protein